MRRSIGIAAVVSALVSLILLAFAGPIVGLLTSGTVEPPAALTIGAALWAVVSAAFNAVGIFLNAASVIKFQVLVASVMAITSLIASIVLANVFGVSGIVWGTLLAYILCTALPITIYLPRLLRNLAAGEGVTP